MARPRATNPRDQRVSTRLTSKEKTDMQKAAESMGIRSISEYLRHLHHHASANANGNSKSQQSLSKQYPASGIQTYTTTNLGKIYSGDARSYLFNFALENSVDLIVTSPPFGLVRKKSYGNQDAHEYCEWFRPFAQGFRRVLKKSGSLVIDIGGAWKKGMPTRSLYHFELLLMLCEEYGFHLCQEHYWWNPAKLPTPAEWVNVRRIRVKDAVNCIWWLSLSPWPKASNRRVLAPYSTSMRVLLERGYTARLRPSGHDLSEKFSKDNGGSVPPNLLAIANTESNGQYQEFCRRNDYSIHPARYPEKLPEYFIRMLTDPDDLVVDPFAGSCVTGAVAEALGRRWVCCELEEEYLTGAMARFQPQTSTLQSRQPAKYSIGTPCALTLDEREIPLAKNGGQTREKSLVNNLPDKDCSPPSGKTPGEAAA